MPAVNHDLWARRCSTGQAVGVGVEDLGESVIVGCPKNDIKIFYYKFIKYSIFSNNILSWD